MNFFKSGFQSVLGTGEQPENASGAETVSENIDYFKNSLLSRLYY
jgi:hypothetical protein